MAYEDLSAKDMVVVDVDGHIVDGSLNLSSDTKTHIEFFKAFGEIGAIPCTRNLTYRTFQNRSLNSLFVSRVLCRSHGPFAWGKDAAQVVYHAVVLEKVAKMAICICMISPNAKPAPHHILDKHFMRKHGSNAYYEQKNDYGMEGKL